ncbi:uncharacterized protein LOC142327278 [Lycorma delicatula]|uniref:uncharacterized protein LOC142327278 n=1 Tax=Lycorma delicatula TaxID=130591 RepID=UPI003F516A2D
MRSVHIIRVLPGIFIVIILLSVTGSSVGHNCYICGAGGGQLESIFPDISFPMCDVNQEIKQCPEEYKGCLIETNGTRITKSCGYLAMNICKTANKVEYCYCQGELCNGHQRLPQTLPPSTISSHEDDDEDLTEGSGRGPTTDDFESRLLPPASTSRPQQQSKSSSTNYSNSHIGIMLLPFFIIIYLV